jgi:hypothetical protein
METNPVVLGLIAQVKEMNRTTNILLTLIEGLTKRLNEQSQLIQQQKDALDSLYIMHNQESLRRLAMQ